MQIQSEQIVHSVNSTPKFNKSRQYKSKSTIGHYQSRQAYTHRGNERIQSAYQQAQQFIKGMDEKITSFKRFNENKVNKKYQYMISLMKNQITNLKTRLSYEENSKNPTKNYMQKILDQLILLKKQNDQLHELVKKQKQIIKSKQRQASLSPTSTLQKKKNNKNRSQQLPFVTYIRDNVSQSISKYLQQKQHINKLLDNTKISQSKLQKYLKQIQKQTTNWSTLKLLQQLDKLIEIQCTKTPIIDVWKIRSGAASRLDRIRRQSLTPTPRQFATIDDQKPKIKKLKQKILFNFPKRKLSISKQLQ